jgi:hypothetical protein
MGEEEESKAAVSHVSAEDVANISACYLWLFGIQKRACSALFLRDN